MSAAPATRPLSRDEALARLGASFKRAMVAVRRLRGRDTHRPGEPSYAQCQLLFGLAERGALTAGELALAAELSPASVTQMLDHLAAQGLVERTRSDRDRRVVTCSLTPRGRSVLAERRAEIERRWHAQLAGFSTAELETAAAVLEQLGTVFERSESDATAGTA